MIFTEREGSFGPEGKTKHTNLIRNKLNPLSHQTNQDSDGYYDGWHVPHTRMYYIIYRRQGVGGDPEKCDRPRVGVVRKPSSWRDAFIILPVRCDTMTFHR